MSTSYYKSSSKKIFITCRVESCSKTVVKQNYKTHLKNKHPAEDYNDLRARGQSSIFFSKSESDNKEDNELHLSKKQKTCSVSSSEDEDVLDNQASKTNDNILISSADCNDVSMHDNKSLSGRAGKSQQCFETNDSSDDEGEDEPLSNEAIKVQQCFMKNQTSDDEDENEVKEVIEIQHGEHVQSDSDGEVDNKHVIIENSQNGVEQKLDLVLHRLSNVQSQLEEYISKDNHNSTQENSNCNVVSDCQDGFEEMLMDSCKSIEHLKINLPEFRFNISATTINILCEICTKNDAELSTTKQNIGCFTYKITEDYDCSELDKTQPFRNLKRSIKRHLVTQTHREALNDASVKTEYDAKLENRERLIGMRLARMAYHLLKKGRPDTDFPEQVLLHNLNGVDVGNVNHSKNFVAKFLPYVAKEVKHRLIKFLTARLPQTGCVPIGKIVADKATTKHRTRHFICYITCVPDAEDLIQALFLEINIVKGHTGNSQIYLNSY